MGNTWEVFSGNTSISHFPRKYDLSALFLATQCVGYGPRTGNDQISWKPLRPQPLNYLMSRAIKLYECHELRGCPPPPLKTIKITTSQIYIILFHGHQIVCRSWAPEWSDPPNRKCQNILKRLRFPLLNNKYFCSLYQETSNYIYAPTFLKQEVCKAVEKTIVIPTP